MLIRNKRPYPVDIVATGQRVEGGDTVEVPDDLGKRLTDQVDVWEEADGSGRPNVDQVLADVGDDPARAAQALAVERESDRPRKSLISRLEGIAATDEEQS